MQPALEEVVQNLTFPASTATTATAVPATPSAQKRRRTPRAPVRWHISKLRFALEGADPSRHFGQKQEESRLRRGNPVAHARPADTCGSARGGACGGWTCGERVRGRFPESPTRGPPGRIARAGS